MELLLPELRITLALEDSHCLHRFVVKRLLCGWLGFGGGGDRHFDD